MATMTAAENKANEVEIETMQAQSSVQQQLTNGITHGDCIQVMREMPANSVDFILTGPTVPGELPRP